MSISKTTSAAALINRPEARAQPIECQQDGGVKCYNLGGVDSFEADLAPQMNFNEFVTGGAGLAIAGGLALAGMAHKAYTDYKKNTTPPSPPRRRNTSAPRSSGSAAPAPASGPSSRPGVTVTP